MLVKRNFKPHRVLRYVYRETLVALVAASAVYWGIAFGGRALQLPLAVATTLGGALAIFIAFRNNSSYNRWWEARTLWGGIVNSSRTFARLVITFTDSHRNQPNYNAERSEAFKRTMVNASIGWVHALRMHLRNTTEWHTLQSYFNPDDFAHIARAENKPNAIQLIIGRHIYTAMGDGTLGGFDSFQMEGQLLALANYQGGCERIKNTPLLRQYDFFTRVFLYVFVTLLPLSLAGEFIRMDMLGWLVPTSVLIAFVFAIIGKVGEVNEDPFENRLTDVPLTALCTTIERDLLELLDPDTELPPKEPVIDGILM